MGHQIIIGIGHPGDHTGGPGIGREGLPPYTTFTPQGEARTRHLRRAIDERFGGGLRGIEAFLMRDSRSADNGWRFLHPYERSIKNFYLCGDQGSMLDTIVSLKGRLETVVVFVPYSDEHNPVVRYYHDMADLLGISRTSVYVDAKDRDVLSALAIDLEMRRTYRINASPGFLASLDE